MVTDIINHRPDSAVGWRAALRFRDGMVYSHARDLAALKVARASPMRRRIHRGRCSRRAKLRSAGPAADLVTG
jgi:hypothetical protein